MEEQKDKNNQQEDKEEDGVDLEDYLYRVYFRDDELSRVKEAQEREIFSDLFRLKNEALKDAHFLKLSGNRYDINSYLSQISKV